MRGSPRPSARPAGVVRVLTLVGWAALALASPAAAQPTEPPTETIATEAPEVAPPPSDSTSESRGESQEDLVPPAPAGGVQARSESGSPSPRWTAPGDAYDLTFRFGREVWLRPSGFLQIRYTQNHRDAPPPDADANTAVFSVPRVRLILEGGVTRYLSFRIRVGVLSNGTARFEQAFADFRAGPVTIRGGIFYLPASIADNVTPDRIQTVDYSQYANASSGGQVAGAGARLELGRTRVEAYLSNGARTSFTELASPVNARVAVTGRAEVRLFTDDGFARFSDESSFRGSDLALRLGVSGHYQKSGTGGDFADGSLTQMTADATFEGDGWNAMVAGRWLRTDSPSTPRTDDFGMVAQAGVFLHERLELWARYDALYSGGEVHPVPPFPSIATKSFQSIDVGLVGYLVPRAHRAKLMADFVYVFGPTAETFVPTAPNGGILLTEAGSQWAVRLQALVAF